MPEHPNYYAILDVPPTASLEEIRQSYRQKAFAAHPDRGGSHRLMLRLNEAWDVLGNPDKRRAYDTERQAPPPPRPRPASRVKPRPAKGPRPPTLARIAGALFGRAFRALTGVPETPPKTQRKPVRVRTPSIMRCRHCGQKLRVKPTSGVRIRCPKCKHAETIP